MYTAGHCGLTLVALAGPLLAGGAGAAARDLVTPVQVPVTLRSLQLVAHVATLLRLGDEADIVDIIISSVDMYPLVTWLVGPHCLDLEFLQTAQSRLPRSQ